MFYKGGKVESSHYDSLEGGFSRLQPMCHCKNAPQGYSVLEKHESAL